MKVRNSISVFTIVSVFFLSGGAIAAEFCVGTALELTNALNQATTNGESDLIKIQQGTYIGNFSFSSAENTSIAVLVGYEPTCSERTINQINTVLDAAA